MQTRQLSPEDIATLNSALVAIEAALADGVGSEEVRAELRQIMMIDDLFERALRAALWARKRLTEHDAAVLELGALTG